MKRRFLVCVSDRNEAKRALEILNGQKDSKIIAISQEAEFFLKEKLVNWQNPLYDFVLNPRFRSKDYVFTNFSLASDFCSDKYLQHFKIRLGYFLAELERSLDLTNAMLQKYKPKLLLIGEVKNYPGSSVVDGTLKTNALWLLAKEQKIPYRLIGDSKKNLSFTQLIGKKIQLLRYLGKQKLGGECDLLILATPSHLIRMAPVINKIKGEGLDVTILTYSVTLDLKRQLDKNFSFYLEKERLLDSKIRKEAKKIYEKVINGKPWKKFYSVKYKKHPAVLNYIRWKIQNILRNETSETFADILLAETILTKLKPKALLVTTDPDTKILPYINCAKENGIKTICIQHGAFTGSDSPAVYPASEYFISWSYLSRKFLRKVPHFKKIQILAGTSPFHKLKILPKKPSKSKNLSILYLCTKHPAVEKGLITFYQKKLFDTLSGIDVDFRLLVRVHPYQEMSNLKSLIENFNHPSSFANDRPLEEVISASDLVIFENTTAGFDAMLAGKPTIYFNPYTGADYFNTRSYNASFAILNINDLQFGFPKFVGERWQWQGYSMRGRTFAQKYLGLDYPMSRIVQVIEELIN